MVLGIVDQTLVHLSFVVAAHESKSLGKCEDGVVVALSHEVLGGVSEEGKNVCVNLVKLRSDKLAPSLDDICLRRSVNDGELNSGLLLNDFDLVLVLLGDESNAASMVACPGSTA